MRQSTGLVFCAFVLVTMVSADRLWAQPASDPPFSNLKTVAESSEFRSTSLEKDVESFLKALDASPHAKLQTIGATCEGRPLHALVVSKDETTLKLPLPSSDPRLVIVIIANIHSGECDGKEGLLALLRDSLKDLPSDWAEKLVIVAIPNFNADANERVGLLHRPGQVGPIAGMGLRENAQNLDLNRDFIKLETPEVRSLIQSIARYQADVLIDAHTTNGSLHRYPLTYDIPHNPATPEVLTNWLRSQFLPEVAGRMRNEGMETFYYGNFDREHRRWEGYGYEPRYSTEYMGMRGRIGILAESYSYASYQTRVEASYLFIQNCLKSLADHSHELKAMFRQIDSRLSQDHQRVCIRGELSTETESVKVQGYAYAEGDTLAKEQGRKFPSPADKDRVDALLKKDYQVELVNRYRSSLDVEAPHAYLIPYQLAWAVERLRLHGIQIWKSDDIQKIHPTNIFQSKVTRLQTEPFQGLSLVKVQAAKPDPIDSIRGSFYIVPTSQPLGPLACYLLEANADENLATWGFLEGLLEEGKPYPILRCEGKIDLSLAIPVTETSKTEKLVLETLFHPKRPMQWDAGPIPNVRWLPDTTEYLAEKNGQMFAVDAASGSMRTWDRLRKWRDSLAKHPDFAEPASRLGIVKLESFDSTFRWAPFLYRNDVYLFDAERDSLTKLTNSPQVSKSLPTVSSDGRWMGYVANNDLFAVDLQTQEQWKVTEDGSPTVFNGYLDWIYQEEIYGRGNFQGYWFSPDGNRIAFLKLEEKDVAKYWVSDSSTVPAQWEETRYPKPGAPMPRASLWVANLKDRKVEQVDLKQPAEDLLICRVHWENDGTKLDLQLQNRDQTQLRLLQWNVMDRQGTILLEEKGKAWIDIIDQPRWISADEFLWVSDLPTGRRHLYRVQPNTGKRIALTQGEWDIDKVLLVDPQKNVWVTGNQSSPIETQLYRIDLASSQLTLVTHTQGTHRISLHASGKFYTDAITGFETQPNVSIRNRDGQLLRMVVVPKSDRHATLDLSIPTYQTVQARDGASLQSLLWLPSSVDPKASSKKIPVLLHVYGGPRNPTVKNQWRMDSQLWHPYLTQQGIAVFQCDNRSSRGNGSRDTWGVHREFGKIELQDLEDAVRWLHQQPWVDRERIAIWGWSYGGYFTSYALTHTDLFCAGIAGAPVTDWRNYDSIYTERYMGLPQQNTAGYAASSVVEKAGQLHGKLLLIHGEQDDNVHIANTYQFAYALQKAGKPFEMMVYPKNRHSVQDPEQKLHMYQTMTDFLRRNLLDPKP